MGFKTGDKVKSNWWNCEHGKTGVVSNNYKILGLHGAQLAKWKSHFTLVKWNLDGFESGELTSYLEKLND